MLNHGLKADFPAEKDLDFYMLHRPFYQIFNVTALFQGTSFPSPRPKLDLIFNPTFDACEESFISTMESLPPLAQKFEVDETCASLARP